MSEASQEPKKSNRGGSHGGGRPKTGEPHTIKFPDPLWEFCRAQPGGAGPFLRRLAEQAMAQSKEEKKT